MAMTDVAPLLSSLETGPISIQGQFIEGTNYTFLVEIKHAELTLNGVYKPVRGERRLWDFPALSLAGREVAAYVLSKALGWGLVPPTVYREEGPLGPGSVQLFVQHDPNYHYFNLSEPDRQLLRPAVLFDVLANNADRKGSHILLGEGAERRPTFRPRHIWLIDHGVCFHVEEKLRTVVWDFAGEPVPKDLLSDVNALRRDLKSTRGTKSELAMHLKRYINAAEVAAIVRRADAILASGHFPEPDPYRRCYPWPPV